MPVAHQLKRELAEAQMGQPAPSRLGDSYCNETTQCNGYGISHGQKEPEIY